jgi:hypothetical protein
MWFWRIAPYHWTDLSCMQIMRLRLSKCHSGLTLLFLRRDSEWAGAFGPKSLADHITRHPVASRSSIDTF